MYLVLFVKSKQNINFSMYHLNVLLSINTITLWYVFKSIQYLLKKFDNQCSNTVKNRMSALLKLFDVRDAWDDTSTLNKDEPQKF